MSRGYKHPGNFALWERPRAAASHTAQPDPLRVTWVRVCWPVSRVLRTSGSRAYGVLSCGQKNASCRPPNAGGYSTGSEIHPWLYSKATLPTGCSQRTENSTGAKADCPRETRYSSDSHLPASPDGLAKRSSDLGLV